MQSYTGRHDGTEQQRGNDGERRVAPAVEAAVLADVLADQFVLGNAAQGSRQLGDEIAETRVAQAGLRAGARPAGVDPAGFVGQRPLLSRRGSAVVFVQSKSFLS